MNMRAIMIACATFMLAACMVERPFVGSLPENTYLNMAGTFTLTSNGELVLVLARGCTIKDNVMIEQHPTIVARSCDRVECDAIRVFAATPWGEEIRGTWSNSQRITFHVDWQHSSLDPLADDAVAIAGRPWIISGTSWTPSYADARQIIKLVENATGKERELVRGGPRPTLEVATLEVADGVLHAGGESTLVVRIVNHGPGTAYRVAVTTRSSVASLHGWRLEFGMIKPAAEKIRRLRVKVPETETARDTMLVLVLTEGNGVTPPNISRRMPIAAPPGRRKICLAGQLTRAQYRAKLAELRAAVAAGDLTQAEFDSYDAQLVTCLQ